jgi:HK97 gp10 family phage protein
MAAPLFEVEGARALIDRLNRLPRVVAGKILRRAMRTGMKIVAERARAEAPVLTGATRKAIKVRAARRRRRGQVAMEVRIQGSEEVYRRTRAGRFFFIPAIIEYGRRGRHANAFMLRAYDAEGGRATDAAINVISAGIQAEAGRGGR